MPARLEDRKENAETAEKIYPEKSFVVFMLYTHEKKTKVKPKLFNRYGTVHVGMEGTGVIIRSGFFKNAGKCFAFSRIITGKCIVIAGYVVFIAVLVHPFNRCNGGDGL